MDGIDDPRDVSLLDCLRVAEWEGELIEFPAGEPLASSNPCKADATGDDPAGVDFDAAATVWCLAQAACTPYEVGCYMRGERTAS